MKAKKCVACGACISACPTNCIKWNTNDKGFYEAVVKKDECISCNKCEMVCPEINGYTPAKEMRNYYLFINANNYRRGLSSSGGFFIAVAEQILKENGVVFGAYIDDSLTVRHGWTESIDDIYRFMSSKYVQSYLGEIFLKVKEFLDEGRIVLFSGTPCQIGGLNSFLQKEYENLYTIELFCGGIPSPYAWESYINDYYKKEEIRYVQFRYKFEGWWKSGLRIQFLHNDYFYPFREMKDPYMTSYLKYVNINDSCFDCKYKNDNKNADFTIGDAWNINRIRKNMDDNQGISSVIVNSLKAEKIVEKLKLQNHVFSQTKEEALFARGELAPKKGEPAVRKQFFADLMDFGFKYAYEKNMMGIEKK